MSAIAIASGGSALTTATGNLTFFVATTGSDSNPGTITQPFATIQHAVSVGLSFDYQSLYTLTINVANGTYNENVSISASIFLGFRRGSTTPSATIVGNGATPTNVVIQPTTTTTGLNTMTIAGGLWGIDGISLKANSNASQGQLLASITGSIVTLGTVDFNTSTGCSLITIFSARNYARIISDLPTTGNGHITIQGDLAGSFNLFESVQYSDVEIFNQIAFNSVANMGGAQVFDLEQESVFDISNSLPFITPTNLTGGTTITMSSRCYFVVGADPTTVTWPSAPFSFSIDLASVIDGFSYINVGAGALVDQSTIYRGSWQVYNNTSDGSVNVVSDNAGKLGFPAIPHLILANGASAEGIYVYNTVDSPFGPTNYERGVFDWTTTANNLLIGTQKGGTGSLRDVGLISSSGNINFYYTGAVSGSNFWGFNANGVLSGWGAGNFNYLINTSNTGNTFQMSSQIRFQWNSATTLQAGAIDTGMSRTAANVVEINNGTASTGPGVILPRSTTFANLPAAPIQGMMVSITDGLAANCSDGSCTTFGTNVTGGTGALKLNLWYNGTNWTLIGK